MIATVLRTQIRFVVIEQPHFCDQLLVMFYWTGINDILHCIPDKRLKGIKSGDLAGTDPSNPSLWEYFM